MEKEKGRDPEGMGKKEERKERGREGGVKGRKGEIERVCVGATCVRAKLLQLCPTLFHPMDCSLPGSSVYGILQAKLPGWVALPSFRGSFLPRDQPLSHVFCVSRQVLYH